MRVCIVDDHAIVREGLRLVLAADPELGTEIVAEASSGAEAMQMLSRQPVDVAVVDYRLPDTTGDILCANIRAAHPGVAVVMLTTYLSEDVVQRCLSAGAAGFVTKSAGLDELRTVLRAAARGEDATGTSSAAVVARLHGFTSDQHEIRSLTPRQERVLELVVAGQTYDEIGAMLHVSEATVRFHIQGLKERLGVRTKAELIATAIRAALIPPSPDAAS